MGTLEFQVFSFLAQQAVPQCCTQCYLPESPQETTPIFQQPDGVSFTHSATTGYTLAGFTVYTRYKAFTKSCFREY